jgi:four helix bundle protein
MKVEREYVRFLQVAYGSLMEVVSQLRIAERRGFVSNETATKIYQQCEQIARMLSGLRETIKRK